MSSPHMHTHMYKNGKANKVVLNRGRLELLICEQLYWVLSDLVWA